MDVVPSLITAVAGVKTNIVDLRCTLKSMVEALKNDSIYIRENWGTGLEYKTS